MSRNAVDSTEERAPDPLLLSPRLSSFVAAQVMLAVDELVDQGKILEVDGGIEVSNTPFDIADL